MRPVLYLCRHGQTDWNAASRFQGQVDIPINETGRRQAAGNGARLAALLGAEAATIDLLASPLGRTRETARILAEALGRSPDDIATDARLMEIHFGDWQTRTIDEVRACDPDSFARREHERWTFRPPGDGAESFAHMLERVRPVLDALERPTLLVIHGGVTRLAMHHLGGVDRERAVRADIPQDAVLRCDPDGTLDWV